ncbi:MAG: transposase [Patescibacteria group bacterium]
MKKVIFAPGEYYHIFCRTIMNFPVFGDAKNADRFMKSLWIANSDNSGTVFQFLRSYKNASVEDLLDLLKGSEKLVDVLSYTLMKDHYHLLLKERVEGGISEFVRKCNISISKYNNIRNGRRGPIFESRFNAKHVDDNRYLMHLFCYILLNPLDFLVNRSWREHGLKNWKVAKEKLLNYPYSSVSGFLRGLEKEDRILSGVDIVLGQIGNLKEREVFLKDWTSDNLNEIITYI